MVVFFSITHTVFSLFSSLISFIQPDSSETVKSAEAMRRNRTGSARARRRERRKQERRQAEVANKVVLNDVYARETRKKSIKSMEGKKSYSRPAVKRISLCSACSDTTSATEALSLCDSSSSSCCTPEPKRKTTAQQKMPGSRRNDRMQQHQANQCRKNKNAAPKSKTKKQQKFSPSKLTVEVEEVSKSEKDRYVAIDCEMVGVGPYGYRSALARVSIVNWEGDVIIDKYVKVEEEVTDYRTFVSGITEADLQSNDAVSFDECRALVLSTIHDKIVVGHALKNDFDALRIHHEWHMIRDTARYEPFMKVHPTEEGILMAKKLKDLARDKLGLIIQEDGKEHDSIVDATAAMELYIKHRRKWEKAVEWKVNKTRQIIEQQHSQMYEMLCANKHAAAESVHVPVQAC